VQGVPKQRSAVFGVQRPDEGIVGHALTAGRPPGVVFPGDRCARHIRENVRLGRLVQWRRRILLP
jgi:hypothetical protein